MGNPQKILSLYDKVSKALGTFKEGELTKKSIAWFEEEVQRLTDPLPGQRAIIRDEAHIPKSTIIRGSMTMFLYDPKTKADLPYYDRFPLVIPIEVYKKPVPSFSGINLHYLNYYDRATLLDMLQALGSPEMIRLNRINYDILSKVRKYRAFRPCVHRYNMDRIKTMNALIPRELWETAIFLPIEDFRKKRNKEEIWKESRRIFRSQG